MAGRTVEPRSLQGPHCPKKAPTADAAAQPPAIPASSSVQAQRTGAPKQRPKGGGCCPVGGENEAGRGPRSTEASAGLSKDILGLEAPAGTAGEQPGSPPAKTLPQKLAFQPSLSEEPITVCLQEKEGERLAASADTKASGQEAEGLTPKGSGPKAAVGKNCGLLACTETSGACHPRAPASDLKAKATGALGASNCSQEQQQLGGGAERTLPRPLRPRGEELQQRATEAVVCAKNIKVSSTGEKVVLWTRYVLGSL